MPQNIRIAREQWARYVYARDTGHREFVKKANRCEDFFAGMQWDEGVVAELKAQRRPALTLNKILITLSSIFGEQIDTRTETGFRPRYGAPPQNADTLSKVFKFISDDQNLPWTRTDVFADGCITSRGYYDVRLSFEDNVAGEVQVSRLNPRAVLPDPDAWEYDPEKWNDVIVTSWATPDDIELMYGKADADFLRSKGSSVWAGDGFDSLDLANDRFGGRYVINAYQGDDLPAETRNIRIIDRQYRKLAKVKFFVDPKTGDKMKVPDAMDRAEVEAQVRSAGLLVVEEVVKRIRWTVTAEDVVLHDEWSPFDYFTVVPYFPHFRFGRTIGVVEGLIDPQELLNKTTSQELHIVNTMANSGWIFRSGALVGKTAADLEVEGAKTGLVLEVQNDTTKDIQKIQPNQIPQGLDRLSFKAENYIKAISGRGDSQLGLDRADVSGKAIGEKKESSDVNLRVALDNLERTEKMLARAMLSIVQKFYTDPRVVNITRNDLTGEFEAVNINMPDITTGEVLNDLSLGTYDVVVTSQNAKRTLEENEFEQALGLRELGIAIPESFLIENSNLRNRGALIKAMQAQANTPEAQLTREAALLGQQLEVGEKKAKISSMEADTVKKRAQAAQLTAKTMQEAGEGNTEEAELALEAEKHRQEMEQAKEKHAFEMQKMREEHAQEMQLRKADAAEKRRNERIKAVAAAKSAARPQPQQGANA